MKCLHKWKEIDKKYYIDYNGYKVLKITLNCEVCNKKKIRKYY